jgi:hypothetical protein
MDQTLFSAEVFGALIQASDKVARSAINVSPQTQEGCVLRFLIGAAKLCKMYRPILDSILPFLASAKQKGWVKSIMIFTAAPQYRSHSPKLAVNNNTFTQLLWKIVAGIHGVPISTVDKILHTTQFQTATPVAKDLRRVLALSPSSSSFADILIVDDRPYKCCYAPSHAAQTVNYLHVPTFRAFFAVDHDVVTALATLWCRFVEELVTDVASRRDFTRQFYQVILEQMRSVTRGRQASPGGSLPWSLEADKEMEKKMMKMFSDQQAQQARQPSPFLL